MRVARERSERLARRLFASGVVMLLVAGVVYSTRPVPPPSRCISSALESAILAADEPLRPALTTRVGADRLKKRFRVVSWSRSLYRGRRSVDAVAALVAGKYAETLEYALRPPYRKELREAISPLDREVRDISILVGEEGEALLEELARDPNSPHVIRITPPRDLDPRYSQVLEARASVGNGRGVVWSRGSPAGKELYFVIRWTDFPALKTLYDEQINLIQLRVRRIRDWIEATYHRDGSKIFRLGSD